MQVAQTVLHTFWVLPKILNYGLFHSDIASSIYVSGYLFFYLLLEIQDSKELKRKQENNSVHFGKKSVDESLLRCALCHCSEVFFPILQTCFLYMLSVILQDKEAGNNVEQMGETGPDTLQTYAESWPCQDIFFICKHMHNFLELVGINYLEHVAKRNSNFCDQNTLCISITQATEFVLSDNRLWKIVRFGVIMGNPKKGIREAVEELFASSHFCLFFLWLLATFFINADHIYVMWYLMQHNNDRVQGGVIYPCLGSSSHSMRKPKNIGRFWFG